MSLVKQGMIAEYRSYKTLVDGVADIWYYGSPKLDPKEDYAAVLDVQGTRETIRLYGSENVEIIYICADDAVREARAMKRGSFDKTEWDRRMADDAVKFSESAIKDLESLYGKPIVVIDNNTPC